MNTLHKCAMAQTIPLELFILAIEQAAQLADGQPMPVKTERLLSAASVLLGCRENVAALKMPVSPLSEIGAYLATAPACAGCRCKAKLDAS